MNEIVQGTQEWFAARLGKVTASRVADLTARTKSGYSTSRANYMAELLIERMTGERGMSFENDAMRWGTEQEPNARAFYEFQTGTDVSLIGFLDHPSIGMAGASPDGLIGDDGLVEFKCPNTATHLATLLGDPIAEKYIKQTQWQMACADRSWCDWVSYDPRMPQPMRGFIKRIPRNDVMIKGLEKEVAAFLDELNEKIARLRKQYQPVNILAAG